MSRSPFVLVILDSDVEDSDSSQNLLLGLELAEFHTTNIYLIVTSPGSTTFSCHFPPTNNPRQEVDSLEDLLVTTPGGTTFSCHLLPTNNPPQELDS